MKKLFPLFVVLNFGVIMYFWGTNLIDIFPRDLNNWLVAFGRLTGLLAVLSILTQFLLMSRAPWLEHAYGLDKLAKLHRLNGYFTFTFILLHPALIVLGYSNLSNISLTQQFTNFLSDPELSKAIQSVFLFLVIIISSIYIVRQRLKYEWWYAIHVFTYLAVLLSWGHQLQYGSDFVTNPPFVTYWYVLYIFVFGQVVVYRFLRPIWQFWKHDLQVTKVVAETESVTSIYISGKNLGDLKARAGQFFRFRFLSRHLWWESHPFSLSALPNNNELRVSIKAVGDFTQKIAALKKGTRVFIEGPLGIFTSRLTTNPKVLLIAGGIGITPIRSLLEQMGKEGRDVILLYSNRFQSEIVFVNEIAYLEKKYGLTVHHILSQEKKFKGETGHLDREKIKRLVPDVKKREIFICGSPPMMAAVIAELTQLGVKPGDIHYEEFSL